MVFVFVSSGAWRLPINVIGQASNGWRLQAGARCQLLGQFIQLARKCRTENLKPAVMQCVIAGVARCVKAGVKMPEAKNRGASQDESGWRKKRFCPCAIRDSTPPIMRNFKGRHRAIAPLVMGIFDWPVRCQTVTIGSLFG